MKVSASKNRKLLKQYPFLSEVIGHPLPPVAYADGIWTAGSVPRVDNLTIKVQKADGQLMFRQANNIGFGDHSFSFELSDRRKGQVMRRGESIFAIGAKGKILNAMSWPRNDNEQRNLDSELYARMVLWKTRHSDGHYSNPIWDETKWLVWVQVEAWHKDTGRDSEPESRFGDTIERNMYLTLYGMPDCGFEKLFEESNVYEHLRVNDRLLMRGAMREDHDLVMLSGMLYELCHQFQDEVYFDGMKRILDEGNVRGASGHFDNVEVLCAEMCGYDRVMLKDGVAWVTFQLRPESKHMYVLGCDGTLSQIRNLVRTVVKIWDQMPSACAEFKPDEKVMVI